MYNPIAVGGGTVAAVTTAAVLPQTGSHTVNALAIAVVVGLIVWAATYAVLNRAN
jgi:LPXTG-motif cell wall-anchored protein